MPYIKQEDRDALERRTPENAGELNYDIHSMFESYLKKRGESYQTYNDIIGVLECAKLELYRRKVSILEDSKAKINGDILFYNFE